MSATASEQTWEAFRQHRHKTEKKLLAARAATRSSEISRTKCGNGKHAQSQMTAAERRRSIPLELLAREWLDQQDAGPETKAYLVERLLPTLIMGLETLLTKVGQRGLEESEGMRDDFNPINLLAQHLMRNNPRCSNFTEDSPYSRALQQVSEDLRREVFAVPEDKLAALRAASRQRREERERQETLRVEEGERRRRVLRGGFTQWRWPEEEAQSMEVQEAVKVWSKQNHSSEDPESIFPQLYQITDKIIDEKSFISVLMEGVGSVGSEEFDGFAEHMRVCGDELRRRKEWEEGRLILKSAFEECDTNKIGSLDRQKVCGVLTSYYDSSADDTKRTLLNPTQWPMSELLLKEPPIPLSTTPPTTDQPTTTPPTTDQTTTDQPTTTPPTTDQQTTTPPTTDQPTATPPTTDQPTTDQPTTIPPTADQLTIDQPTTDQPTTTPPTTDQTTTDQPTTTPPTTDQPTTTPPTTDQPTTDQPTTTPPTTNQPTTDQPTTDQPTTNQPTTDQPTTDQPTTDQPTTDQPATTPPTTDQPTTTPPTTDQPTTNQPTTDQPANATSATPPLEVSEFSGLLELFLGAHTERSVVESLATYVKENYRESEEERALRQQVAQAQQAAEEWQKQLHSLFFVWDVDRCGSVDLNELQLVIGRWDGLAREEAQDHMKEVLASRGQEVSRLSRALFCTHLHQLSLPLSPASRQQLIQHLTTCIEHTEEEVSRGQKREEALVGLRLAGQSCGLQFRAAMEAAISTIRQGGVEFGGGKKCSVSFALLEEAGGGSEGCQQLCYQVSTEAAVVGKSLSRNDKQVSFKAVDNKRPVHIPDIQKHGGVAFLCPDRSHNEFQGSLVVVPIPSPSGNILGTISVDTLTSSPGGRPTTFEDHEIHFYQGVGVCLGELYQWMSSVARQLREVQGHLAQLLSGTSDVSAAKLFLVEPQQTGTLGYQFRQVLPSSTVDTAVAALSTERDYVTRSHLFRCAATRVPVSSFLCGQHHLAWPVRGRGTTAQEPHPQAVVDLATPPLTSMEPGQLQPLSTALEHISRWQSQ